jgi:TRAP-type C4-dicarboxylate transport system permease small subunit
MNILVKLDRLVAVFTKTVSICCFVGLMILLSAIVFVRFVPIVAIGWSDEVVEWMFAWMVFMGAARMWRDGEHFRIKFLEERFKGKPAEIVVNSIVEILSLVFLFVMTYYSLNLTIRAHDSSPVLVLPRSLWYLCIPLAGVIMSAYSIRNLLRNFGIIQKSKPVIKTPDVQDAGTTW